MFPSSKEFAEDFKIRYIELAKRLMVLRLLEEPMTSYELSEAIHQGSNRIFPVRQVFAVLVVLEQMEAVEKLRQDGREVYRITEKGRECLQLCLDEFYPLRDGVNMILQKDAAYK
ncbi:MAG: hypothetical protein HFE39_01230 [Clostridiales bacterium]|jgi:DNA-binding PadR family transcriptional regulator|nr:hypothetical protein [Clostridiales bacterium]